MSENIELEVTDQENLNLDVDDAIVYAVSPTATVTKTGGIATITITDKNGTTSAQIHDGQNGAKGDTGDQGPIGPSGPTGPVGPTPNISIGTVSTLDPGSDATVTITGTAGAPVLNFGIPEGDKGDTGDTGETGAAAGFGTVSATVDSNVGTPSVTVTASGPDTAKEFAFAFSNMKGETGQTGQTGNGIASIELTSTSGSVKTYTITYTNGNSTTFNVTDGEVTNASLEAITGDLGDLTTTAKNTIVAAINEIDSHADTNASDISDLKEDLQDKADQNGVYPDLSAGNITGDFHIDTKPYLYRALKDVASHIGSKAFLNKLVGGTVAWNQIVSEVNAADEVYGITRSKISDGHLRVYGTSTVSTTFTIANLSGTISSHRYFISFGNVSLPSGSNISGGSFDKQTEMLTIGVSSFGIEIANGVSIDVTLTPMCIDLTQMLGSTIANRAYTLETAQSGSGIAWLKSYGYFLKDYYPYNTGTLTSVKTSAHVTRNADDTIINNYPLDDIELRGVAKLVGNEIKYDGDVYESDGTVTRNYGYRAYEAGDESLANAITDGTHTVYKLNTPTTELADPFTSPQTVFADGTEEYIDTRTVPIPVGHETKYELDLAEKLIGLPWDLSMLAPIENGTTASQAYAAGKYFVRNNEFCKAKTSIASGATFTLGTNYEVTTVGAELYALQ